MFPHPKNLLTLLEYSPDVIRDILASARALKKDRLISDPSVMARRTGVLIFEKPSLRTRITFETAIHELGGHAVNLTADSVWVRESIPDVARNLDRMVHMIVTRTYSHSTVAELAQHCSVPVINALSDRFHPCQALALAMTLSERVPEVKVPRIAFIGDGNNVCNSLMVLSAKLGFQFVVACPNGYEPPSEIIDQSRAIGKTTGANIEVTNDPHGAVQRANVIYTDVWTSMGQEEQAVNRAKDFPAFQVNEALLSRAPSDTLISHCLPAHRGEEITSDVLDSPQCIALDEAENRLHVQKAVICHIFA